MENLRKKGSKYEDMAADYLEKQGLVILERNYRTRMGEIDIIARDKETLVFVEVKYRKSASTGSPFEAVGYRKQVQIARTSDHYRMMHGIGDFVSMRFDVVGIKEDKILWIKDAFTYV